MDVLPFNFRALYLCGIWRPEGEKLSTFRMVYRCIAIASVFYITTTFFCQMIYLESNDVSEFTDSLYLVGTYVTLCVKIVNFLLRRSKLTSILRDLRHPYCRPGDEVEIGIIKKYNDATKKIFIYILLFVLMNVVYFVSIFIINLFNGARNLPFNAYQFYDISHLKILLPTAIVQSLLVCYCITLNISFDTLYAGLLMLITGQLELNVYRFSKLNRNNVDFIKSYIVHNILINEVIEKIESFVTGALLPLLFFNFISVCASLFQLSQYKIFSFQFFGFLIFSMSIYLQVFVYCWFGNEMVIMGESIANAIYSSEWASFNHEDKKTLQIVMLCNKDGRTVSYGGQCSLTLPTFVWIIKTSYATVNLLHHINLSN